MQLYSTENKMRVRSFDYMGQFWRENEIQMFSAKETQLYFFLLVECKCRYWQAAFGCCTPLKEGVIVIKEDTTMEQLRKFCEACKERWGVTALQVFIHRDEGHYRILGDNATWKPNLHAHIVWDWMNHDTGKSCKLDEKAMSEMQTVLAECLEMERGTSKEVTGKEHLERTDFIIAKQKQETERRIIEGENKVKEQYRQSLDTEIADKERQLKDERKAKMDSILDSFGSLVGVGKSAAMEKEIARLKTENEHIKSAFPNAIKTKVEELAKVLVNVSSTNFT